MAYAEQTTVPIERSRAEIERILSRYGASQFASGWGEGHAVIGFKAKDRLVRFDLPIPDRADKKYIRDGRGTVRNPAYRQRAWEQDCRQRWRALALAIKAKLEAVETGITTFEQEFLAHIVLPGGQTVGAWIGPQLDEAYTNGSMPRMLPMLTEGRG
ncbi:MAG TPA: hypothetical protein DCP69_10380 [Candidatus Omnitrophica bacterium]|nr:hypothetical protein [Candidatus Omnitrophota bacterium]